MTVQVIHQAFTRGIDHVQAASERLERDRARIDDRVSGFLAAGWSGVAAEAFMEAWEDWKLAATDVRQGLDAMAQLMDAARRDLMDQDVASQQSLDAISAQIIDRLG